MIHLSTSLQYYKRPDVQQALLDHAEDKEIAIRFNDRFGKRPNILSYPDDILSTAQQGATSFHASEELWRNPLQLTTLLKKEDLTNLRKGWDLILDIDCQEFEYSKLAAELIIDAFKAHGIHSFSIKFSGNKGFHLGIPFEAFPEKIGSTETEFLFPEAAQRIALYLKETIKAPLKEKVLAFENNDFSSILKKIDLTEKEVNWEVQGVESFLVIDTVLISSRHLYRMPYSLHEKSGLVSLPFPPHKLKDFTREIATPESVKVDQVFLDRSTAVKNNALNLFIEAFDFNAKRPSPEKEKKREYIIPEEAIPEQFFPPCIKKILEGMEDGKKRALFILINFLASCGWDYDAIEKKVREWNKNNKEALKEVYLVSQLRYAKQQKKRILPPNCSNPAYYKDLRVKCEESICSRCHNPINYARRKAQAK